jgi:hypothetical protein
MDGDRKYSQRGYQDRGNDSDRNGPRQFRNGDDRPKPSGPKPHIDITGPRLPRLVQAITASRCYACSTTVAAGTDLLATCPKCSVKLHCCKQCAHFEPSTRFQCLKPIPARIAIKDQVNECTLFSPRVTVSRDGAAPPPLNKPLDASTLSPRTPSDARDAFDRLFKK